MSGDGEHHDATAATAKSFPALLLHCAEFFASKNLKLGTMFVVRPVEPRLREPFGGEGVVVYPHNN
jgi:hypothetical protein